MENRYRVWTRDVSGSEHMKADDSYFNVHTEWLTKGGCRQFCIDRWGHIPPYVYISQARNLKTFVQKHWRDFK